MQSVEIVIHFGMNPVNGGIPLNDRSMSGTKSCIRGDIKLSLLNWFLLISLKVLIIKNRGIVIAQ